MSEDWIKEARRLRLEEGASARDIAKRIGVTRDKARAAIADIVESKTRPAWHVIAVELHSMGLSPATIGARLGKSTSVVHGVLKSKNITPHRERDVDSEDAAPHDAQDQLRAQCRAANDDFLADLRRYHGGHR